MYKKSDLRNSNLSLLRRIQRQTDKTNEREIVKVSHQNKEKLGMSSFSVCAGDFIEEEKDEFFKPMKTKLSLYNTRRGKR